MSHPWFSFWAVQRCMAKHEMVGLVACGMFPHPSPRSQPSSLSERTELRYLRCFMWCKMQTNDPFIHHLGGLNNYSSRFLKAPSHNSWSGTIDASSSTEYRSQAQETGVASAMPRAEPDPHWPLVIRSQEGSSVAFSPNKKPYRRKHKPVLGEAGRLSRGNPLPILTHPAGPCLWKGWSEGSYIMCVHVCMWHTCYIPT
jgi:hypothetical protein